MRELSFNKGDVILDRWEIIEKIGYGGFGDVFKAHDKDFERPMALKFILKEKFPLEHRGFKVLLDVNHPNVVRVFDFRGKKSNLVEIRGSQLLSYLLLF